MPLKSFQNDASLDNLQSYWGRDRVLSNLAKKAADQQAKADEDQAQLERAPVMSSPEFKQLKKQARVRHADGTTGPASDEYVLQQLTLRRAVAARKKGQQ